ncbi:MAG: GlmU family protein [Bacteroidales bacterium]|nr:GlmU family protein [Bacteroidales bacterium]
MNIILSDDSSQRLDLLPLTYTRPAGDLRVGILTIQEKWQKYTGEPVSLLGDEYLRRKYVPQIEEDNLVVDSRVLPDMDFAKAAMALQKGCALVSDGYMVAARINAEDTMNFFGGRQELQLSTTQINGLSRIKHTWDIFTLNEQEIERDFKLITAGRKSARLSDTNRWLQPERIFVEEGAKAEFAILNPAGGYIYLGKDSEVMENAVIHGSLALCEHSCVKIGAKIYGATTMGPHTKCGGEVNNSVIWGYSNKGHDGFLGNSVLGQWCNLGADTNNSNLKNNYAEVKLWNYATHRFVKTGLQFCGLIMGDHSKSSINTMFNTGTVVGVSSNVFGTGFPRNFVPSFSWGGADSGYETYPLKNALTTAQIMMKRRDIELDDIETEILTHVFEESKEYRHEG